MENPEIMTGIDVFHGETELFRHVDPDDYMWTGDGNRSIQKTIEFEHELPCKPHILTTLTALDASHAQNLRYRLEVIDATRHAFACRLSTWGDTKIAGASVTWLALCPSSEGSASTLSDVPENKREPQSKAGPGPKTPPGAASGKDKAKQDRRARRAARRQNLQPDS